jgi:hypothetical protein
MRQLSLDEAEEVLDALEPVRAYVDPQLLQFRRHVHMARLQFSARHFLTDLKNNMSREQGM